MEKNRKEKLVKTEDMSPKEQESRKFSDDDMDQVSGGVRCSLSDGGMILIN